MSIRFCITREIELEYVGEDGEKHRPVVIHRAILGSSDRFISFLLEETKGILPVWLSPVQVQVMPITDKQREYAVKIAEDLRKSEIRVELDDRQEKIGYKIREAQLNKVPYMLILGDKEIENNQVGVRSRTDGDIGAMGMEEFKNKIKKEIESFSK